MEVKSLFKKNLYYRKFGELWKMLKKKENQEKLLF